MKRILLLLLFLTQLSLTDLYGLRSNGEKPLKFIQAMQIPRSSETLDLFIYHLRSRDDAHHSKSDSEDSERIYLGEERELDPELFDSVFDSPLLTHSYQEGHLLVEDSALGVKVALLSYEIAKNNSGFKGFHIEAIWVEEGYRRIGITQCLLRMSEKLALKHKCDFLSLETSSALTGAKQAYVKAGYQYLESPLPPKLLEKGYFMYKILTDKGREFLSR